MNAPGAGTDLWTIVTILGLALVTVVTRSFFFMSRRPMSLPAWAERGLPYAPIAALSAVVLPEVFMVQGQLLSDWHNARVFAAAAGAAFYFWRRGVLGTLLVGMAVYLPLHMGLGW